MIPCRVTPWQGPSQVPWRERLLLAMGAAPRRLGLPAGAHRSWGAGAGGWKLFARAVRVDRYPNRGQLICEDF